MLISGIYKKHAVVFIIIFIFKLCKTFKKSCIGIDNVETRIWFGVVNYSEVCDQNSSRGGVRHQRSSFLALHKIAEK